jgi:hypothetical protein
MRRSEITMTEIEMTRKLELGDEVMWHRPGPWVSTALRGRVVEVVPPGRLPSVCALEMEFGARSGFGHGSAYRNHESYVILSRPRANGCPVLYWPLASALVAVSGDALKRDERTADATTAITASQSTR